MVTSPQGLNVELLHTSIAICSLLLPLFCGLHRHWSLGCSQSAKFKLKYKNKQRTSTHILSEGPWCSLDLSINALSFLKISKPALTDFTMYLNRRTALVSYDAVVPPLGTGLGRP